MEATYEQHTEHTRVVAAPARVLYGLVADVTLWPALFGPSVHVRHLERSEREERFELWASVNGSVTSWVSHRTLAPEGLRVTFAQEVSRAPFASMGGEWLFRELPGGHSEVVLRHSFSPVDRRPETVKRAVAALDHNSSEELAALARIAELGHPVEDIAFSFSDSVGLSGAAADAYAFVARADLWADRLPHVARVRLAEPSEGVQELEMDTLTADGAGHTTRSVRVCRAPEWIAYKQLVPPKLLLGHSGLWTFTDGPDGAVLSSRHTVLLHPGAVAEVLGPDRGLADARDFVRDALGRNSATTMAHAAQHAERHAARTRR
ncbi:putative aromatase [Streptomyces sp. NBRC 110611]|uniref:aromatase/cyclase n=1 Tax=Streptomyces sp. NBRC 110611 TaxID=1621259 RepID=UPI00082E8247|nr:aromatase/cyclase [Streptomyces sp. NBRC 110611]GAU65812.1 putative aromatase [Streptomyces sp. NBRC 110611]